MTDFNASESVTVASGAAGAKAPVRDSGRRRVLHIIESLETGGMERMVSSLALQTDRVKFEVHVLCLKRLGPLAAELEDAGIVVHRFAGAPGLARYVAFLHLARVIRQLAPAVVHSHNSPGLFFGATAAWLAGVPRRVHTEHGRRFPDALRYMLAEHLVSHVLHRYVCVSQKTRDDVAKYQRVRRTRLVVVPNGVPRTARPDAGSIDALRDSLRIRPGAPVVGTVGRLVAEKDYDGLLGAFAIVLERIPDAELVIVGDGPLRSSLEERATALSISNSVHFTGMRRDVSDLYHLFDVFVMSSISEGLPLALLEAMASARSIVATRVGGIPDALESGRAGVLVPPSAPDVLALAISDLLVDHARALALSLAASQAFSDRYDISIMVRRYEAMYDGDGRP